jgi:hypothetical protein
MGRYASSGSVVRGGSEYWQVGAGPAVVLLHGGVNDAQHMMRLASTPAAADV